MISFCWRIFFWKRKQFVEPVQKIQPRRERSVPGIRLAGNVRELANIVERAVILSSGEFIMPVDIPIHKGTMINFRPFL